jgi:arylsulfatase A-like enzyme
MTRATNILLVIADDMGVHQLAAASHGFYETPCLDEMARAGATYGCAYSAAPVCSPGRAALYTGQHPARLHLTNYIPGTSPDNPRLLTPEWRPYLPVGTPTLGTLCGAKGYRTGHFGKWHLARDYHYQPGRPTDPESHGFAQVRVTRKPKVDADPESDAHHVDEVTEAAIRFVAQDLASPFLCVVAYNALHRPELAPAALVAKYAAKPMADGDANRPVLAAMLEVMDRGVGRLRDFLREIDLEENTLVVFTSDHGAFGKSEVRKPLRGAKADLYEAGLRVPLIWCQPGRLPPGRRDGVFFGTDMVPTLLDLVGIPGPATLDGVSHRARLLDPQCTDVGCEAWYWHFPHYHHLGLAPMGAIRQGRWKLIEWFEASLGAREDAAPYELFDLEMDPAESRDLALEQPARCAQMRDQLLAWRRKIGAQEMVPNPDFDPNLQNQPAPPPPGDPGNPFGE